MKVSKNCGVSTNQGCLSNKGEYNIDGTLEDNSLDTRNGYKIILSDGTSVYLNSSAICIDIDGPNKGNNTRGYDLFWFTIKNNIVVPYSRPESFVEYLMYGSNDSSITGDGRSASAWIIDYDNMDYLKLGKDGKCPNGTTPTEQNPRCK